MEFGRTFSLLGGDWCCYLGRHSRISLGCQESIQQMILSGLLEILSMKDKRDVWTIVFIGVAVSLAWHHSISDIGVTGLMAPILAKIYSDHKKSLVQMQQPAPPSPRGQL